MQDRHHHVRILAIDPAPKGFGFAVLEGRDRLIDWGVARVWAKSEMEFVARVDAMVTRYRPTLLTVPEIPDEPRRAKAARRVAALLAQQGNLRVKIIFVSRMQVKSALPGTKHERAVLVARHFPELQSWSPPPRRPWMTEDERIHIFEAVGLAMLASDASGGNRSDYAPV